MFHCAAVPQLRFAEFTLNQNVLWKPHANVVCTKRQNFNVRKVPKKSYLSVCDSGVSGKRSGGHVSGLARTRRDDSSFMAQQELRCLECKVEKLSEICIKMYI